MRTDSYTSREFSLRKQILADFIAKDSHSDERMYRYSGENTFGLEGYEV